MHLGPTTSRFSCAHRHTTPCTPHDSHAHDPEEAVSRLTNTDQCRNYAVPMHAAASFSPCSTYSLKIRSSCRQTQCTHLACPSTSTCSPAGALQTLVRRRLGRHLVDALTSTPLYMQDDLSTPTNMYKHMHALANLAPN